MLHFKNESEFKKTIKVQDPREAGSLHQSDEETALEQTYDEAIQTLRDLSSLDGTLFLGRTRFNLSIEIDSGGLADGANVYKGIEDALNEIAYHDDQQNQFFRRRS